MGMSSILDGMLWLVGPLLLGASVSTLLSAPSEL